MSHVQRLPEELANQIAAGEVVERPAAVVKELVENAIDAGARRIEVVLEDGGRQRVEVLDDGSGMSRADALLALERHTTSKLQTADDLFDIRTFGFRGEALPSIASVARLRLTTRTADALSAVRLEVEGGRLVADSETGAPVGTRMEVCDLFFNVPARLKFLKARATEVGHVMDWLTRLALANPAVAFLVREESRTLLKADATSDLRERAAALLGRPLYEALYPVDHAQGGVRVHGLIAGPQRQNNGAREIFTFVNGRFVRDRGLMHAISRAYDGVLLVGRSPAVALFIELPPAEVDVNVHPQKLEVRFSNARTVYDATVKAIAPVLAQSPWLNREPGRSYTLGGARTGDETPPSIDVPVEVTRRDSTEMSGPSAPEASQPPVRPASQGSLLDDLFSPGQRRVAEAIGAWKKRAVEEAGGEELLVARRSEPSTAAEWQESELLSGRGQGGPQSRPTPQPLPMEIPAAIAPSELIRFSELRPVGQVHRTYLVCESPHGLVLLDQHAAHERVLYERLRAARAGESVRGQPLLVPLVLDFSPADARMVESVLEELSDLGLELEPFGGDSFSLKSAPPELDGADLSGVIRELALEVRQTGRARSAEAMEEALLTRMACHTAIRKGAPLSPPEVQALLEQLDGTPYAAQCPHGRPVAVRFSVDHLKELFGRTYEGRPRPSLAADGRL